MNKLFILGILTIFLSNCDVASESSDEPEVAACDIVTEIGSTTTRYCIEIGRMTPEQCTDQYGALEEVTTTYYETCPEGAVVVCDLGTQVMHYYDATYSMIGCPAGERINP